MSKKQKDLPTMERPSIDAIDDAIEKHQKAKKANAKAELALKTAAEETRAVLIGNLSKLETDKEGNSVYPWEGGDKPIEYVIPCVGTMRTRKPTKAKDDSDGSGDLE